MVALVTGGAAVAQERQYTIPAQSLAGALSAFGRSAGLQIAYPAVLAQGREAPGLQGSYTPDQALARLLAGSGLRYEISAGHRVTIFAPGQPLSAGEGIMLDRVTLEGQGPWGPVAGYVATGSAAGTKGDTTLLETPQSISVITRDQVEAQGARSLSQALRYSPGVVSEVRGTNSRYDVTFVRGFGAISDPTAYVDGLSLQRGAGYAFPQAETYGMERIEVLRGPSSSLYGASIPGGLVNLVSKRPGDEARGEVGLLLGSYDRVQGNFDVTGPLSQDLSYRLVGLVRDAGAEVVNAGERRYYIAPSLRWQPTDNTSLTLLSSVQRDPEGGYYGTLPTVGSLWPSAAGQIPRDFNDGDPAFSKFEREQKTLGYEFRHRFNDTWAVQHNFRYLDLDVETRDAGTLSLGPDQHTIHRYALHSVEALDGITSDLQLQGNFTSGALTHRLLLGYDFQYIDWSQRQAMAYPEMMGGTVPPIDYLNPIYGIGGGITPIASASQTQKFRQHGLYVQDQIRFGSLSVLLGGRYDFVSIHNRNHLTGGQVRTGKEAFSGRVGAVYDLGNGVAPYASYSSSFLPVTGTDYLGNTFDPSTAEQYELGVKYQPGGFDGFFSLSLFDIRQDNIVNTLTPTQRYQVGRARSRGLELEGKAALSDNLNIIGSLTWTHARIKEGMGFDVGNSPVNVPDHTASLWLDYSFRQGALAGLTLGGGARYIGKSVGGYAPNAFTAPGTRLDVLGYTLVDASLRYDLGAGPAQMQGYDVQLAVSNLFDRNYVTCNANNFCNYGNGRTVTASLNYKW